MSRLMERPVLMLNAAFEPISIAAARDALRLVVNSKAFIVVGLGDLEVYRGIPMPSVVRLAQYRHVPHVKVQPRRRNIYLRDGYRCQYCGERFNGKDLTLDHVIPKAQKGPDTWENLVACCTPCNRRKANRTPLQAGMPLLRKPRPMNIHTNRHMMRLMGSEDPAWREYLYC